MLIFIVVGIIVLLTIGYFFLMYFYPEWVGISGEDSAKTLSAHQESKDSQDETSQN